MNIYSQNVADTETEISNRINQLHAAKRTFQPTLVFVGELKNISTCMVAFDSFRYYVDTVIDAIELALCIFFALDVGYPLDSEQIWLFIQQGIAGIKMSGDRKRNGMSVTKLLGQCS